MAPFLNKLTRRIDRLQSQHHALTDRSWLVAPSGRANGALFEMVYDDYPYARIFRLQTQ